MNIDAALHPVTDLGETPARWRPGLAAAGDGTGGFRGNHVHFVGIGGCGMSGLARMARVLGAICTGSDQTRTALIDALEAEGIQVQQQRKEDHLPERCDLVITSAAIKADHPELLDARRRGVPVIGYAEALGRVQCGRTAVCIAGTHGKSTTAAMLCHTLLQCGFDPSYIVGAQCDQLGGGSRIGSPRIPPAAAPAHGDRPGVLVAEACEFNRSFLHHQPVLALINNIEEDHLDVYGSLERIVEAFGQFAQLLPPKEQSGRLLIAHEGAHRREVTAGLECAIETFGFNPAADYQVITDPAVRRVGVLQEGVWLGQWTNQMPGEHNALNAAAAGILASLLGAEWESIGRALGSFAGLQRRLQRVGAVPLDGGEVIVYDDYGHHPTEVEKTLTALRAAERPKRLICVFQPHQHSRTRFLMEQFAQSFSAADVVIVPPIYFVRDSELERQRVSAEDLVERLQERGVTAMHLDPFEAIVEQLQVMCRSGDLLVIMGAGPVGRIAPMFLSAMSQ